MKSAFGVDHGHEIEKFAVPGVSRLGSLVARGTQNAGASLGRAGAANTGAARALGKPPTPGLKGMKVGLGAAGAGQRRLGSGLGRLGTGMAARPGLTGGATAGAAGAAGAADLFGRKRK